MGTNARGSTRAGSSPAVSGACSEIWNESACALRGASDTALEPRQYGRARWEGSWGSSLGFEVRFSARFTICLAPLLDPKEERLMDGDSPQIED